MSMQKADLLYPYVPIDRLHSILHHTSLPDRVRGAALFADISGFTPLTAALANELGRQRGAEQVLTYINPIYEAIITELRTYRGSVIGFAGDSITCWLDGDDGRRAVACAMGMQEIMSRFATITTPAGARINLSIKIAVAAGSARRFLAGDPQYHNFDALAGATLERMAAAEHEAEKGEVVVSQEVADALGDGLAVVQWRHEEETQRAFAAVSGLTIPVEKNPWPILPPDALTIEQVRPWIDAPVYDRLMSGASYLAELRPATSIFVRFSGIDYDGDDDAGSKLDAYIRWVQAILARYEGFMLQLTIGDKGSNLLAVFGAPVAHDDDEARGVAAALDLRTVPSDLSFVAETKVGVSQGLVWAGACGGRVRCIYTVMGDEVNMAARLMGKAAPGQVLVNQPVADATARRYRYHSLGAILVKGKAEPLPVSEVLERRTDTAQQLSSLFASPLVGREAFLDEMHSYLAATLSGQGQVLRLEGPAGIGKSHLAAVFSQQAGAKGWQVAVGACQSITQGTAYAPWRQLMFSLLELTEAPVKAQVKRIAVLLAGINPDWEPRLPLLGDLLGLPIPDNAMTSALEPRLRQQALFTFVAEIVQVWGKRQPLLLVIEDAHWLDEASVALTIAVGRAIGRAPVVLLVVQRPPLQADQLILPELDHLSYYHFLQLGDLSREGVGALVGNRLRGPIARLTLDLVMAQAQGNPFFTEELVDALREAGYIQPDKDGTWVLSEAAFNALLDGNCLVKVEGEWQLVPNPPLSSVKLDIPDSVHGTVLARMDRLPESHKLTLKVASVIGRTFGLSLLQAAHPVKPDAITLQCEIEDMGARDFVRLETGGTEPVYIFKHNTTQEVAYSTLLFVQRQQLHTAVAEWYEHSYGDAPLEQLTLESGLAPHYPVLVHHWHNAENNERERVYAGLAGEQAAKRYANEGAVHYYSRAIDLTPNTHLEARYQLLRGREGANDILAHREAQAQDLAVLADLAAALNDDRKSANVSLRRANYAGLTDDYQAALEAAQEAVAQAARAQDLIAQAKGYHEWGRILWKQGKYETARVQLEQALHLAQIAKNRQDEARILYDIGIANYNQTNYTAAQTYFQQAQTIYQETGYRPGEIQCLFMFGALDYQSGNYMTAQAHYEQALAVSRSIGWRLTETHILGSLGNNAFDLGDYRATYTYHERALVVSQEIGYRYQEAVSLDTMGLVHHMLGDNAAAQDYYQRALIIQNEIGDRRSLGYTLNHLGLAMAGSGNLESAQKTFDQAMQIRRELGQKVLMMDDLAGLARVGLIQGDLAQALRCTQEILDWLDTNSPDGIEFPVLVYLTCYRVLRACAGGDAAMLSRADVALKQGRALLEERANRIHDETLRQQFLENVPFNRDLMAAYQLAGQ